MTTPTALRLLIVLYLCLGTLWAVAVPPFEKPDEIAHFSYLQLVATQFRIPRQATFDHPFIENESQQPPLYYILVAVPYRIALALGVPATDLTRWRLNPGYYARMPDGHGEIQYYAPDPEHMSREDRNTVPLDILLPRLISLLMGAGVVWLTFRIAVLAAPGRKWLPLVAAAGVATLPQFTFVASTVTNDNLSFLWGAATLLACIRALRAPAARLARYGVWLGVIVGVGVYVKATMLTLVPLAVLALILPRSVEVENSSPGSPDPAAKRLLPTLAELADLAHVAQVANRADRVPRIRAVLLMMLVALCIGAPWFARNVWLYRDLLGRQEVVDPSAYTWNIDRKALWSPYFMPGGKFWMLLGWSLVGMFGAMDILMPRPFYVIWRAVLLAAVIGVPVGWLARRRSGRQLAAWQAMGLLAAALALALIGLVRYNLTVTQPQGRYLFHIMPAMAVMMAVGLAGWLDVWRVDRAIRTADERLADRAAARRQAAAFAIGVLALAVVNVWALFGVLAPVYYIAASP